MARKYVYSFGEGAAEGREELKSLLGGKGVGLAEMSAAGVPVPPGFTITTEVCTRFRERGSIPVEALRQIDEHLELLQTRMGGALGQGDRPLLVSVRSGAAVSMPGMMDSILNLGLSDRGVKALAKLSGDERFALDAYRRLMQMYGDVVLGVPHDAFEKVLTRFRKNHRAKSDGGLATAALREIVTEYKALVKKHTKRPFPQDPKAQLMGAVEAVFRSWDNERARVYRALNEIPDDIGTACTVQAMVFGNRGETSATGVGFTRNPATGEPEFYGEFLLNAQGEDVVAGIRTPHPIAELGDSLPEAYAQLRDIAERLERHYGDMQDFEFTIEEGRLYMLQTRTGKRTGIAAVRVGTDMVDEGLITREEAVIRVEPVQLLQLLHPVFDPIARREHAVIATGLSASPGAASGIAVFSVAAALAAVARGETPLLLRHETSPEDIEGMACSAGILTAAGGMTSHAAVVGRQMGKPAVVGCATMRIDAAARRASFGTHRVAEGEWISIDGTTGEVIEGRVATTPSEVVQVVNGKLAPAKSPTYTAFDRLLNWADLIRRLRVRANADNATDGRLAAAFGAEGIGLCRTEHMFFGADRVEKMRAMILARSPSDRAKALKRLLPLQRRDFIQLFRAMDGLPVTIRTLDPPLHEFLPNRTDLKVEIELLKASGPLRGKKRTHLAQLEALLDRVDELSEVNPMLGWRGCRLTIIVPEIVQMQARAIMEAAAKCTAEGIDVRPEIMVPLVGHVEELRRQRLEIEKTAQEVMAETKTRIPYTIGTMIEVPRGALTANAIANHADFFSFGTNDLTQTTFGFSRDDAAKFLGPYVSTGILPRNPFVSIDREGVGELMRIAVERGRATRQGLKIGICGEHGGDPQSVGFCHDIGLDYVSCSPYRVPVARLAAAQAALHERGVEEITARAARNRRARQAPTFHGTAPRGG
jgi:pyruvate,orthophosphate dikinase